MIWRHVLILSNSKKRIIFSGKSAPRKLRKSRIDQANAIEEENDESVLKCISIDAFAEDEDKDSKEGKNMRYRRCIVLL